MTAARRVAGKLGGLLLTLFLASLLVFFSRFLVPGDPVSFLLRGRKPSPEAVAQVTAQYGLDLGYAFQIADDVLDYVSDAATMGKNVGDDLAEGKPTLPLIHVMQHGTPEQAALVRGAIEHGGRDDFSAVLTAIQPHLPASLKR